MNKLIWATGLIFLLFIVAAIASVPNPPPTPPPASTDAAFTVRVNDVLLTEQDLVSFGALDGPGTYTKELSVTNTYHCHLTLYLSVSELPPNCSLTWQGDGATIAPSESVHGTLILVVAEDYAGACDYIITITAVES